MLGSPGRACAPATTTKGSCLTKGSSSHYEVLRVAVTATEREIKVAYRKAARASHPDHGGDAAAFRQVTLAYETLIDPQRRAAYDRSYATGPRPSRADGDEAHFDAPGAVPLLPPELAGQQVHGMPRKRGIFGAEARIQRELRTVQLISRQVLPAIPAARLINGLQSPADNS